MKMWLLKTGASSLMGWLVGVLLALVGIGPGGEVLGAASGLAMLFCGRAESDGSGHASLPDLGPRLERFELAMEPWSDDYGVLPWVESDNALPTVDPDVGQDAWQYAVSEVRGLGNGADVAMALSGCCTGTDADVLLPSYDDGWSVNAGWTDGAFGAEDFSSNCGVDLMSNGFGSGMSDDW